MGTIDRTAAAARKRRRRTTLALLLVGLSLAPAVRAQAFLSDQARISLLTALPGDAVYSQWGHSAVRVQDPMLGLDRSYNYGTFDFDALFVPRFLYGALDYLLSVYPTELGLRHYRAEGRPVIEQILALGPAQRDAVFRFLEVNARPENRVYRYDFLYDNCSTRIRDALDATLGDDLRFAAEPAPGLTFRRLLDPYLADRPFLDAGVDLLLGTPVDRVAQPWETMFLPDYLAAAFDEATVRVDGAWEPLVATTDTLLWIDGYAAREAPPWAAVVLWSVFAGGVAATLRGYRRGVVVWRPLDVPLFVFVGTAGLMISFLWAVSLHAVTAANGHLLWAWPTHLVAAVALARRGAPGAWLRRYLIAAAAVTAAAALAWPVWPQYLHPALVPLMLLAALRSAWIGYGLRPEARRPAGAA